MPSLTTNRIVNVYRGLLAVTTLARSTSYRPKDAHRTRFVVGK